MPDEKEFFIKYWGLIKMHFPFFCIVAVLGFGVCHYIDEIQIQADHTYIDNLKKRIEDYKQRLGKIPLDTKYSKLTDSEFRKIAVAEVEKLHVLARRANSDEGFLLTNTLGDPKQIAKENEKMRFQDATDFLSNYLTPSQAIRDEMYKRLPKKIPHPEWTVMETGVPSLSNFITNTADSLERLIKLFDLIPEN